MKDDLISRQAVLDLLFNPYIKTELTSIGYASKEYAELCVDELNELPSVNPQEPKMGHWIDKDGKEQGYDIAGIKTWYIQIMCSECGFIKTAIEGHTGQYHYCPNCGCRMFEPQESEDNE